MIAITGATGKLGRLVVEGLLERFPAEEVVALARNPERLPANLAETMVDADLGVARGELDCASKDLHHLIGRATQTLDDLLASLPRPQRSVAA